MPVLAVTLSSLYSASHHPATHAIDGNVYTLAASGNAEHTDQYLSLRVAANTIIRRVRVYNRDDYTWATAMLNPYEVWLTTAPFAPTTTTTTTARLCGANLQAPGLGPYDTLCDGTPALTHVTLVLRADPSRGWRLLTGGEEQVFV